MELFGQQNVKLNLVKHAFPELRITSRGNQLKISGEKPSTQDAKRKLEQMVRLLKENQELTTQMIQDLLNGENPYATHKLTKENLKTTIVHGRDGKPINGHFFGQSSFATYSITNADALVAVPGDTPLELLGPLACGFGTGAGAVLNEARPRLGDSVLIVGVGAVGLAAIMAARNSGVTKIIAADLHDNRLEMAQEFGATHTINSGSADLVETVRGITGSTVDFAIDCTGVIPVIEQLAETVGMLGTLVLVGGAPANARFSLDHLRTLWGKRVIGVLGGGGRSGQLIPALVELYQQGRFPFESLVRYYELGEIEQSLADSKSGEVVKPILRVQ